MLVSSAFATRKCVLVEHMNTNLNNSVESVKCESSIHHALDRAREHHEIHDISRTTFDKTYAAKAPSEIEPFVTFLLNQFCSS